MGCPSDLIPLFPVPREEPRRRFGRVLPQPASVLTPASLNTYSDNDRLDGSERVCNYASMNRRPHISPPPRRQLKVHCSKSSQKRSKHVHLRFRNAPNRSQEAQDPHTKRNRMERNETFFEGPPCSPPYDGPSRAAFCAYEIALGYPKSLFRRAPWSAARGLEAH